MLYWESLCDFARKMGGLCGGWLYEFMPRFGFDNKFDYQAGVDDHEFSSMLSLCLCQAGGQCQIRSELLIHGPN